MKLKIKNFNIFSDKTGSLIPFYINENLENFKIKRFFFLYGKKNYLRADHGHKKCNQILIPIKGTSKITIINKKKKKFNFIINKKNRKYLFVPKYHWIKIRFSKTDDTLLTLCDYKYDKKEYIDDLNEFYKT